jgi:hypothetical protein
LSEAASGARNTSAAVSETMGVVDSAQANIGYTSDVAETLTTSEGAGITQGYALGVGETTPLVESVLVQDRVSIRETITVYASLHVGLTRILGLDITVPFVEGSRISAGATRDVAETVALAENATDSPSAMAFVREVVPLEESCTIGTEGISPTDRSLRVRFAANMDLDGLTNPSNYAIAAVTGYPVQITAITPIRSDLQSGTACRSSNLGSRWSPCRVFARRNHRILRSVHRSRLTPARAHALSRRGTRRRAGCHSRRRVWRRVLRTPSWLCRPLFGRSRCPASLRRQGQTRSSYQSCYLCGRLPWRFYTGRPTGSTHSV